MRVEHLLGTRAEVVLAGGVASAVDSAEQAVLGEAARLEALFSVFDQSSALHQLRVNGVSESSELNTVIALANEWSERTAGAFHAGCQGLVNLWDRAEAADALPSVYELNEALAERSTVEVLNLNAIAKGWIAESCIHGVVTAADEVSGGWLSLGGDVVHVGDGSVVVGIEDPKRPYDNVEPMATVELSNEALATSGGARRWWTIGGRRLSKVLDPRTGQPVDHIASATVIAPEGAGADVLATVALVLQPDETIALVAEHHAQCLLIARDGEVICSSDRFRRA